MGNGETIPADKAIMKVLKDRNPEGVPIEFVRKTLSAKGVDIGNLGNVLEQCKDQYASVLLQAAQNGEGITLRRMSPEEIQTDPTVLLARVSIVLEETYPGRNPKTLGAVGILEIVEKKYKCDLPDRKKSLKTRSAATLINQLEEEIESKKHAPASAVESVAGPELSSSRQTLAGIDEYQLQPQAERESKENTEDDFAFEADFTSEEPASDPVFTTDETVPPQTSPNAKTERPKLPVKRRWISKFWPWGKKK